MEYIKYPPSPDTIEERKIVLSTAFRKQVSKVIGSIILFLFVYLLLVLAAAALAVLCFYLGLALIIALPKLITVIIGIGLMCLGVSVIYFLIKFIFATTKDEDSSKAFCIHPEAVERNPYPSS